MATIKIPTPLRAYTGGEAVIDVQGSNVGEILNDLTDKHPALRQHIFEDDKLRSFVNIFIGQEDTRFRDGLETPVDADDELRIIPSIAGG
jgi:molybdopterin converting factor small subunit